MGKLDLLKKLGKAAGKVAGIASADDRVGRLEAEKDLLAMKLELCKAQLVELADAAEAEAVKGGKLADEVSEAREALRIVDGF